MADDETPTPPPTFVHPGGHDVPTTAEMADVFATFPPHNETVPQYECQGCHLRVGEQWRHELVEYPNRTMAEHGGYHDRWLRRYHLEHGVGDVDQCPECMPPATAS